MRVGQVCNLPGLPRGAGLQPARPTYQLAIGMPQILPGHCGQTRMRTEATKPRACGEQRLLRAG
jgi:hypothetical protein